MVCCSDCRVRYRLCRLRCRRLAQILHWGLEPLHTCEYTLSRFWSGNLIYPYYFNDRHPLYYSHAIPTDVSAHVHTLPDICDALQVAAH